MSTKWSSGDCNFKIMRKLLWFDFFCIQVSFFLVNWSLANCAPFLFSIKMFWLELIKDLPGSTGKWTQNSDFGRLNCCSAWMKYFRNKAICKWKVNNYSLLTFITLFWDSATIEARNTQVGHNKGGGYLVIKISKDTMGKALELPSWEPVKMVYGWVGLPRVALCAGHPVDEGGEDVECVAHCAHDQAWATKKSNFKKQAIWGLRPSFTSTSA